MSLTYSYKYQAMFQRMKGAACMPETEQAIQPVRLFGDFIYQGDFAVMCGPENAGKSVFGLQIADALSRGHGMEGFETDCGPQKVVYVDFENKHFEFVRRYTEEGKKPYQFDDNFSRMTLHPKYYDYTGLRKELLRELNGFVPKDTTLLVVNNLEFLKCFVAESYILGMLKEMQVFHKFTVLLLAGSRGSKSNPKAGLHQLSRPIRGIADSIFALGHSKKGPQIRYLKQLKSSKGQPVYDDTRVAELTIGKQGNFTGLHFTGYGKEYPHVAEPPTGVDAEIIQLKLSNPSLTYLEIAEQLDTYKMKVKRTLDKYAELWEQNSKSEILNPKGEGSETLEAVVTNNAKNDAATGAFSFSNTRLQPGGINEEDESSPCPLLQHTASPQGGMPHAEPLEALVTLETLHNDTPAPLISNRFRSDVEPSVHPSDSGVNELETLDVIVTNTVKDDAATQKQLSYSEQLKKRFAEGRKRR